MSFTGRYLRLATISIALTVLTAFVGGFRGVLDSLGSGRLGSWNTALVGVGIAAIVAFTMVLSRTLLSREAGWVDLAERQATFLDEISPRLVPTGIFAFTALSLFLELAVIRWHAAAIPILAFYKNYSLIAAFAGLGLGYALYKRLQVPLFAAIPVMAAQLLVFWVLKTPQFGEELNALKLNPFAEQATMGIPQAGTLAEVLTVYVTLASVFLATALVFIPIGQTIGRLMLREENLRAYGLNLAGSIAGVGLMFAMSALWTPPAVWFGLSFLALAPLLAFDRRQLTITAMIGIAAVAVTATPARPAVESIHTPYQLLEVERPQTDLLYIRSAGHFLLTATDLSPEGIIRNPSRSDLAVFYEFPFALSPELERVLIVGSGAGNDIAAALRVGAESIDAVEIDPAIVDIGQEHPERPYQNPRVKTHVDDARAFLATADGSYDLIVYGLLDSHSVVSHGSSVRMDSYVYTVEGLHDARSLLEPEGIISLSFFAFDTALKEKLFKMLTRAFDGIPPQVIEIGPENVVFLHSPSGTPSVDAGLLASTGYTDATAETDQLDLGTDVATDDWPFLYMPRRVFPFSYLGMVGLVLGLTLLLIRQLFAGGSELGNAGFFFLGAGFLLVETKGITELGLAFGNTWVVVAVVIVAVLAMSLLANLAVARFSNIRLEPVVALLIASVAVGFVLSVSGAVYASDWTRWLVLLALTVPVFFSGLAFSAGLKVAPSVSGVLAVNLAGAIVGGLVEYNSMLFGFRSLYVVAGGLFAVGGYLLIKMRKGVVGE